MSPLIQDPDLAPAIADQLASPEDAGGLRDALAPQSEHMRQELVGQVEFVRLDPVARHQQPSRQPCFRFVKAVAGGRLRNLRHQRVGVPEQRVPQRPVAVELDAEGRRGHAQRIATPLHDGANPGDADAEDERHSRHALVAHHSDLEGPALVDGREQRNQAVEGEVDVPDRLPRLVEHLTELQRDRFELGLQPLVLPCRDARQHPIRSASPNCHFVRPQSFSGNCRP